MMSTCIYCPSTGPFSLEHPLPASLGEFESAPLLPGRICKDCNTAIGQAEEQLGRSGPEALLRVFYGIAGRTSHDKVNPFERGSAGARAIDFVAPHPETGIPILWELNRGSQTVREVTQVVIVDTRGEAHRIRISNRMTQPDELRECIEHLGVEIASIRVFAEDAELARVESLLAGVGYAGSWESQAEGAIISNPTASLQVTTFYFRALAKAGFHYLLATTALVSGAEPEFSPIRDFIRWGIGSRETFVEQQSGSIIQRPSKDYRPERPAHLIVAEWSAGQAKAKMQFFFGPECEPTIYCVRLGQGLKSLAKRGAIGHCYAYFEQGMRGKFVGEASQLIVGLGQSPETV